MDGKANIYDIAQLTGTTITAVSRAFDPNGKIAQEKRELILEAAKKYGYRPNRAAGSLSRKAIKLGCVLINNIHEYNDELVAGINSARERLADFKVEGEIRLITPGADEAEKSLEAFRYFAGHGFDGILTNIEHTADIINEIGLLADSGIPCAIISSDIPSSRRLFSIRNDLDTSGRMAAQLLSMLTKNGRTLLFSGSAESFIHSRLIKGFTLEARECGMELLQVYDTRDIPDVAAECASRAFSEHPDADGIYISSANSLPILEYMTSRGLAGRLRVVASDVFPKLGEYITSGAVDATIYQNPFEQASLAFEKMYTYLTERTLDDAVSTIIPQIVIKSNLKLYENRH